MGLFMPDAKKEKSEVSYTPVAAMKGERCGLCEHFRPMYDLCTKVKGQIKAGAWCELFKRK